MVAFVMVAFGAPATAAGVAFATLLFVPLPATLPEAAPTLDRRITHILDAEGNEIATIRQFETGIPVAQGDIAQVMKDAVVASEDKDFYSHGGIDPRGTLRALLSDLRNKSLVEGGSTITQQYVKQAFTSGERSISRKIREAILAAQLDRQVDKDTILYRYLSIAYFGGGAYGVGAAAETFFRKPVGELTASEAATLASVLPAPSAYEPRTNPALAEQRRVRVLGQMRDQGRIDQATYADAVAHPLWLVTNGEPPGPVTLVHPPVEQQSTEPWFRDYVVSWLKAHLPGCEGQPVCEAYDKGGLTVITTLDPKVQAAAEQSVAAAMGDNDPRLGMGLAAIEPATGFVKAMVGGRDFAASQVNLATFAGEAGRQPGSSFKPIVLAAALESGITPSKTYNGSSCPTGGGNEIENYGGARYGTLDLRTATWDSVNTVYCRLIQDVGVDKVMAMATRLGLSRTPPYDPAIYGDSISLGVTGASPLEMAAAYGIFANHGGKAESTPVLQVLDADGNVLIDNTEAASKATEVLPPVVADNVTDILRGVLTEGTAAGKGLDRPAAGKTGTAEQNVNAWFVGYTPTLSTAVWIGYTDCENPDDLNCRLRNINGVREVTGGSIPLTTWQRFMKQALSGVPVTEFTEPAPIQSYAEQAERAARGGFDPGPAKSPTGPPSGGPYLEAVPDPVAVAPPVTAAPTTSTTSTTVPVTSTTRRGILVP